AWAHRALQGVAYWVGHRRCLYRGYPLSEGALVAEVCNLIYANLPDRYALHCEVQYSELISSDNRPEELQGRVRADIVVFEKNVFTAKISKPKFIIEVKRASAPNYQINSDLRRLAAARAALRPDTRTFLFVISEATRPRRFVNAQGHSILLKQEIPDCEGYFRVRRTWKAAHAFTIRDSAQYACLVEVFAPDDGKKSVKIK